MIILGIDPGSRSAGYAFIESQGKRVKYLDSGVLKFDHVDTFLDRLPLIYDKFSELIKKHQPDEIALESLIYVKSVSSLAKLAQARGAMAAASMKEMNGKIYEYSPNLVKSTVCGHGHADKQSVEKSLSWLLGQRNYKTHDESDALAIAVCHALLRDSAAVKETGRKQIGKRVKGGQSLAQAFKHLEK
jgi:crossover junction endodeoxyribonuclease RuvC